MLKQHTLCHVERLTAQFTASWATTLDLKANSSSTSRMTPCQSIKGKAEYGGVYNGHAEMLSFVLQVPSLD